jgi:hypothetical protein
MKDLDKVGPFDAYLVNYNNLDILRKTQIIVYGQVDITSSLWILFIRLMRVATASKAPGVDRAISAHSCEAVGLRKDWDEVSSTSPSRPTGAGVALPLLLFRLHMQRFAIGILAAC